MKYYKKITINGKKVKLHRYIIEKNIGRKLSIFEVVHHKDGDIYNNNIENLEIMSIEEHSALLGGKKKNYPKNCKRNRKVLIK